MAKDGSRAEGAREVLFNRLKEINEELEQAGVARRTAEDFVAQKRTERADSQTALHQGNRDRTQADKDRQDARQQRINAEESVKDDLAVFGRDLHRVLDIVHKARWHGETPVGPFGRYVKARDGQWANVLRSQIGRLMSAFAITDMRDRPALLKILKDSGKFVSNLRPLV